MADKESKVPVKTEKAAPPARMPTAWQPFEALQKEIDRVFEDFTRFPVRQPVPRFRPVAPP